MAELSGFFEKYDRLVLFDTETTGLFSNRDEIIEFAAVVVEQQDGQPVVLEEYDELITLSPGGFVPPMIQNLTGITNEAIREKGIPMVGNSRRRGDQRFTVVVETPTKLTKEQKELLRQLDEGIEATPKRKKFFDAIKDLFD